MSTKKYDIKARISEDDYISLTYLQQTMDITKSDVVRIAIDRLLECRAFIEEFSFCEIGCDFKKFDGIKKMTSSKYGFLVTFWNEDNFSFKGNIAYKIYIPYKFLSKEFGVNSYFDYEKLSDSIEPIPNMKGNIDDFHNFIADIRGDIEEEIFNYLKSENLIESW